MERPADRSDAPRNGAPALARWRLFGLPALLRASTPIGLFFAALAVRCVTWRSVYQSDGVYPFGNDAFYHLRRIVYSVVRFPDVLDFDRYINYPEGAKPIWSPLFDWAVAAVSLPFFRPGEIERRQSSSPGWLYSPSA